MNTAWDPATDVDLESKAAEACPRCGQADHREHLMQTNGVAFYRCGACGHMFILRTSPPQTEPAP
jgi:DNA-directed RNA polymerase subunit M/transcription elongation factor TFIIS